VEEYALSRMAGPLLIYDGWGSALWIKWLDFRKLSNVTCCAQSQFAPSANVLLSAAVKIHKISSVAARNFTRACQIFREWHSHIPRFFLACVFVLLSSGCFWLITTYLVHKRFCVKAKIQIQSANLPDVSIIYKNSFGVVETKTFDSKKTDVKKT